MLVFLAIALPAIVVAPFAGLDPGIQPALKLAVLALVAIAALVKAGPTGRATRTELWFAALAGSALLGTIVAGSGLAAAAPVVGSIVCLTLIVRAARSAPPACVETAVLAAALSVAAIAFLELLGVRLPWSHIRRPESTLGNRNEVAMYLALALPIIVTAAVRGRTLALAVMTLAIAVLVATHCRGAYLASLAALAWSILQDRAALRRLRPAVVVACLSGVALGCAPWPGVTFAASVGDSASRMLELGQGSGRARLRQHELGVRAILAHPEAITTGFGAGSWERIAAAHAHDVGDESPRFTGATVPNSELLRTFVEQGVLGILLLVVAFVSAFGRAGPSARAVLVAAGVLAVFDPLLVRPECVALLGAVIGIAEPAPQCQRAWAHRFVLALGSVTCAIAMLRATSFVAAGAGDLDLARRLFPRPGLDERAASMLAARGDCARADRALDRFLATSPAHWGARVAVARCFTKAGQLADARRVWRGAFAVEPHVRAKLFRNAEEPARAGSSFQTRW